MSLTTRRRFLAAGAIAPAFPAITQGADEPNWIDAHVHVWTPDRERYPLSGNFSPDSMRPPSFTPKELAAVQEGTGVARTVLIQMSFYEFDNRYMIDTIAAEPDRFRGVAIVDHAKDDVATTMKALAGKGVTGFRLYAFVKNTRSWASDEGIRTMWRTGAEEGLAMCCLTDPDALPDLRSLCEAHPETPVVIDHFARIGTTGTIEREPLDQLLALAVFPRVHVKVSAFYALGKKAPPYTDLGGMIREVRDAFGSERLMWGSDCPYQVQGDHSYEASVALIRDRLDFLSETDRANLMRDTAERVFFR